jgi:molybdenum cofactor cytidylyltransferase
MTGDADTTEGQEDATATAIVVLAAGAGSRFDGPGHKLTAVVAGRSVADRSVAAALDANIGPVIVVTGATELDLARSDGRLRVVHNPDWAAGQSTSLRAGIAEAERLGARAVVVGLADQPFILPEAWRLVAAATSPIAVATYGGERRNPVRLHHDVWHLLPTSGDEGARSLIRVSTDLVEEVPCPGSPVDIDTLEDLRAWQNKSSTNSP